MVVLNLKCARERCLSTPRFQVRTRILADVFSVVVRQLEEQPEISFLVFILVHRHTLRRNLSSMFPARNGTSAPGQSERAPSVKAPSNVITRYLLERNHESGDESGHGTQKNGSPQWTIFATFC